MLVAYAFCPALGQQTNTFPSHLCSNLTNPTAAEKARLLLLRMHTDPAFPDTWGPYWAALPGPDDTFSAELFTASHLQMLQSPAMVSTGDAADRQKATDR